MSSLYKNFLGHSPAWYKLAIIAFLVVNPLLVMIPDVGYTVAGWALILEFIFTLAMALKCYPLQPGGLLVIEAVVLGLTSPENVYEEALMNFEVILLLMFMVAGIYFMKGLLLFIFSKIFLKVRSKIALSLIFCLLAAFLSAFLDALTVTAVIIAVAVGFYTVYHKVASGKHYHHEHDHQADEQIHEHHREDLDNFRAFMRSLLMHAAVGTALGGVATIVGEPQNLLIGGVVGWHFADFFMAVAPVSMPVLVLGLLTTVLVEKFKLFGYGATLPQSVYNILKEYDDHETAKRTASEKVQLLVCACAALILIVALAFHLAPVGLVGLLIIVLQTAFNGITDEHQIGAAFKEALPFTSLLVVFFAVVAVIHDQHLFHPIVHWVFMQAADVQPLIMFFANGLLSAISDNVFVATVYITEVKAALDAGDISREHFEILAVAVNTGTNLPSVATPNGQAAFLFLLTSAIAPLVRLSYGKMVWMALPYTIVLTGVGAFCVAQL
ncbi:MAG: sodium/proton antiporter NhaB [Oceanospirillaceae bacterium]|nr:sodium/proton antiporter NhaB [Oceanospirillaceae bacterium]MCP5349770.1 sodium/proton antiporter NhaB [Oceanospirillaceae bacterium]